MTLAEFIEQSGKSRFVWAEEAGVQKDSVYRHLAGKRVSYETAVKLSKATGNKVKAEAIYKVGRQSK